METIELSVEKARSKGDYQIASVELENWVAAGRQMLAERMSAGSHCAGPTGPSSAASSTVPAPARRQLSRGLSASALAMAPRLGRGKSSATPSIVEESAEDSPQAEVRLAAAQRMLQKAGHAGEAVLYICLVDKHNERGKVQPRALVLTGVAVYNCDVGCARLKRRIPLRRSRTLAATLAATSLHRSWPSSSRCDLLTTPPAPPPHLHHHHGHHPTQPASTPMLRHPASRGAA